MKPRIDINVMVKPTDLVLCARSDLVHYDGQRGRVHWISGNVPEYAMVFWPGLSCSSLWAVRDLENVK